MRAWLGMWGLVICLISSIGGCATPQKQDVFRQEVGVDSVRPLTIDALAQNIGQHQGPVSIGGARYSQGGQTRCADCLFVDTTGLNHILRLDEQARTVTLEAGVTWRQLQEYLDPLGFAPRIMQSYSNFSIGGSLAVNAHGRYVREGAIIRSVRSIKLVLADGRIVNASRTENRDLFDAAIGGYGGIGVIAEATLDIVPNQMLEKRTVRMNYRKYRQYYDTGVATAPEAVLHTAILYPPDFTTLNVTTASVTGKNPTQTMRLRPPELTAARARQQDLLAYGTFGKWYRRHVHDVLFNRSEVVWRNYEVAEDVTSIAPPRKGSRYMLQEYFVPVQRFEEFVPRMAGVFKRHKVNVVTLSVRQAAADEESYLGWARVDIFAFVIFYEQPDTLVAQDKEGVWTREMADMVIAEGGAWYLPYKILATREQFAKAYPRAPEFFAVKARVDPTNKFRNRLWEAYGPP
jgi:FAD/FMN-containing dehydrogenase